MGPFLKASARIMPRTHPQLSIRAFLIIFTFSLHQANNGPPVFSMNSITMRNPGKVGEKSADPFSFRLRQDGVKVNGQYV